MRTVVAVLGVLTVAVAGCVLPPTKVSSAVQMPARSAEAARLRNVGVLRFEGRGEADITSEVESTLSQVRVEEKPYFTVVERGRLEAAIGEIQLASQGAVNPASAARLGKMIAAKGIYMGAVTRDEVGDEPYSESRRTCGERSVQRNRQGNLVEGPCVRWDSFQVSCTRRSAAFEFVPKLVAVESGQIVYSRSIPAQLVESACSDQNQALSSPGDMRRRVRAMALQSFREDVAPYSKMVQIAFMTSNDGITSPAAKESFSSSLTFARESRLDRACEMWGDLGKTEKASASLTFNQGVCAEVAGETGKALELYTAADRMTTKPDKVIAEGLARIRERQEAESKLKAQGHAPAPAQTAAKPAAASPMQGASLQPVAAAMPATKPAEAPARPSDAATSKDTMLRVQAKLRSLGYDVGTVDGVAGARTKTAIRRFQSSKSLPATGEPDAATRKALGID